RWLASFCHFLEGYGSLVQVSHDNAAAMLAQRAKYFVTSQDCFFPYPEGAAFRFISRDELAHCLEQTVVEALQVFKIIKLRCVIENPGRYSLLDEDGTRAVFCLVQLRSALPFDAEQRAHDGGPSENSGVRQMKNVM